MANEKKILVSLLQTHPSYLTMKEMSTNVNFCCLSHNYPFGATNFLAKAWCQQFFSMCAIHVCNAISLVRDEQKMSPMGALQTIVLNLQSGLLQKRKRAAT
jgi:hypothetical protein